MSAHILNRAFSSLIIYEKSTCRICVGRSKSNVLVHDSNETAGNCERPWYFSFRLIQTDEVQWVRMFFYIFRCNLQNFICAARSANTKNTNCLILEQNFMELGELWLQTSDLIMYLYVEPLQITSSLEKHP